MISYLGISLTVCAFLLGWLSWKNFQKGNYKLAVFLLVLIGLLLRVYTASDFFLHPWDERYHALVAKNMLEHPFIPTLYENPVLPYDPTNWVGNHVWLHKQPLPLWGMMSSIAVFGANEIAIRIPSILLSIIGICLTYRIGRKLFNRNVGYYAAALYAINGHVIEMASGRIATDHIDIFFLFFIQLGIVLAIDFAQKKQLIFNVLCGVAIGLAILSKWLPALIVLPIWGALLIHSKRFSWKEFIGYGFVLVLTIFAVAFPWQYYIHTTFPVEAGWEAAFNVKHIYSVLDHQSGPFYYHFEMMRINYGEIIYLPLGWFTYKTVFKTKDWKYWSLLMWILIPYIFFTIVATKMQGYTLLSTPAIFIISGLFFHYLSVNRSRFNYRWIPIVVMVLLFVLPIRFAFERVKPFTQIDRNPEWQAKMIEFTEHLPKDVRVVVFNVDTPIEMMFYSNATVYRIVPEPSVIDSLIDDGYHVYINGNPPAEDSIKGVTYINLPSKPH